MREMVTELPLSAREILCSVEQRSPEEILEEVDPLRAYRDRPWHGWAVGLRAVWIRRRILTMLDKIGVDVTPIMDHWDLWILAFCRWLERHPMVNVEDMQHTEHAMRNFLGQVFLGKVKS